MVTLKEILENKNIWLLAACSQEIFKFWCNFCNLHIVNPVKFDSSHIYKFCQVSRNISGFISISFKKKSMRKVVALCEVICVSRNLWRMWEIFGDISTWKKYQKFFLFWSTWNPPRVVGILKQSKVLGKGYFIGLLVHKESWTTFRAEWKVF